MAVALPETEDDILMQPAPAPNYRDTLLLLGIMFCVSCNRKELPRNYVLFFL